MLYSDQGHGRSAGSEDFSLLVAMAASRGNGITSSSNMKLIGTDRIACRQGHVFLLPLTTSLHVDMVERSRIIFCCPQRELNLRSMSHEDWNSVYSVRRDRRRLNASSGSPKNGAGAGTSMIKGAGSSSDEAVVNARPVLESSRYSSVIKGPAADAEVVSDEANSQEVTDNSLQFFHRVALDILAPPDLVWTLWTDIRRAPLWMRWIDRVEFLDDDAFVDSCQDLPPGLSRLSRWVCNTIGFEVVWVARLETVESNLPVRVLKWATVEGLPSRGEVTFKENGIKGTTVELSISHSLPAALGQVMQAGALRVLVQNFDDLWKTIFIESAGQATLQSDLECFQTYAAHAVHQQLHCVMIERWPDCKEGLSDDPHRSGEEPV